MFQMCEYGNNALNKSIYQINGTQRKLFSHGAPGNSGLLLSDRTVRTEEDAELARIQRSICLAGWSCNLSVCHLRRCPVGGYRCKRTHWRGTLPTSPPASLTAVCCTMWSPRCSRQNNPHSYTHESVHLAPHAHIKPQNHTGMGTLGSLCRPVVAAFTRYSSEILLYFFYSVHRKAQAEVLHS